VNGYRMVVCTPGLWPPVSAPYSVLREPLVAAERWLNSPDTASASLWRRLAHNVGGEHQVIQPLETLLAASVWGWRLTERDGCTKIMLTSPASPVAATSSTQSWPRPRSTGTRATSRRTPAASAGRSRQS